MCSQVIGALIIFRALASGNSDLSRKLDKSYSRDVGFGTMFAAFTAARTLTLWSLFVE